jgi:hypothetical protein
MNYAVRTVPCSVSTNGSLVAKAETGDADFLQEEHGTAPELADNLRRAHRGRRWALPRPLDLGWFVSARTARRAPSRALASPFASGQTNHLALLQAVAAVATGFKIPSAADTACDYTLILQELQTTSQTQI